MSISMLMIFVPIAVVIVSMACFHRSARNSMIFGSIAAIAVAWIGGYNAEILVLQTANLFAATLTDNWALFLSLLVFGMLVYTMTGSDAPSGLEHAVARLVNSPMMFAVLLLMCCIVFSVDDYLACIVICMSLTKCGRRYGMTPARIAVFINLLVGSVCTLVPYSTWAPVIEGALAAGTADPGEGWRFYAFLPLCNIILVEAYGIFHSKGGAVTAVSRAEALSAADRRSVIAMLISAASLVSVFFFCNLAGLENALFIAACASLLVTVIVYNAFGFTSLKRMYRSFVRGIRTMGDLDLTLVSIWMFTGLLMEVLHLDTWIVLLLYTFQVPVWLLPMLYFVVSALFSYFTGSCFASFRLMIPLAVAPIALLECSELSALMIGAVISGSLFAASSMTSDTLNLTVNCTGSPFGDAFALQCRYGVCIFVVCVMSYLCAGVCAYFLTGTYARIVSLAVFVLIAVVSGIFFSGDSNAKEPDTSNLQ